MYNTCSTIYEAVKRYDIELAKGFGGGMPTIRKVTVDAAYPDACNLAVVLCKENGCGAVLKLEDVTVATFQRCTWVRYNGADGQAILDEEEECDVGT